MEDLLIMIVRFAIMMVFAMAMLPFIILFHELGHAIAVMVLTKKGATIFIGSYGNKKQSFRIKIGQLDIWVKESIEKWSGGLCIPKATNISINKQIIYILCGTLSSIVTISILCYVMLYIDLNSVFKPLCIFAIYFTISHLFSNLRPRSFNHFDGSVLHSDGYLLSELITLKRFPEYGEAVKLYDNEDYEKSAIKSHDLINRGFVNETIYFIAATSYMFNKDYQAAYELYKKFKTKYPLNSDDYYNLGLACFHLKLYKEEIFYFKKSLKLDPNNPDTLNTMGYNLTTQNKFAEAIPYLDKAIEILPDFAYALNNRGYAKIGMGALEEGLADIEYSMQLDKENSYVYRNLGVYHLAKNEKDKALMYFMQAKEMDKDTDLIDELIAKVV